MQYTSVQQGARGVGWVSVSPPPNEALLWRLLTQNIPETLLKRRPEPGLSMLSLLLPACHLQGRWHAGHERESLGWLTLLPLAMVQGHSAGWWYKMESRFDLLRAKPPSKWLPPPTGSTAEAAMAQSEFNWS